MSRAFWQSATMNVLTGVESQVGGSVAMRNHVTSGMLATGSVSDYLGVKMSNWAATNGGWLANAGQEIIYNGGKGAILSRLSGSLASFLSG